MSEDACSTACLTSWLGTSTSMRTRLSGSSSTFVFTVAPFCQPEFGLAFPASVGRELPRLVFVVPRRKLFVEPLGGASPLLGLRLGRFLELRGVASGPRLSVWLSRSCPLYPGGSILEPRAGVAELADAAGWDRWASALGGSSPLALHSSPVSDARADVQQALDSDADQFSPRPSVPVDPERSPVKLAKAIEDPLGDQRARGRRSSVGQSPFARRRADEMDRVENRHRLGLVFAFVHMTPCAALCRRPEAKALSENSGSSDTGSGGGGVVSLTGGSAAPALTHAREAPTTREDDPLAVGRPGRISVTAIPASGCCRLPLAHYADSFPPKPVPTASTMRSDWPSLGHHVVKKHLPMPPSSAPPSAVSSVPMSKDQPYE